MARDVVDAHSHHISGRVAFLQHLLIALMNIVTIITMNDPSPCCIRVNEISGHLKRRR